MQGKVGTAWPPYQQLPVNGGSLPVGVRLKVAESPVAWRRRLERHAGVAKIGAMKRASWNRSIQVFPWLAVLLAACAGSPTQQAGAPVASSGRGSGNADELAADALNTWAKGGDGPRALGQIQKAVQSAPQRTELVWLQLRICMDVPGCDPQPIEAQLRKLDPDNGVVWLGPLARAQARRDARAEEQILDVMSKAGNFNIYWTTLVARLTPPVSRTPAATSVAQAAPTPLTNALNATIGWLSSLVTPVFTPLSTACDEQHVREPATRVRCEVIAQTLQKSDTNLAEGLGVGIAQRLVVPGSGASMQLVDTVNTLRYQHQASGAVVTAQVEKEKFSEQMLKLMTQLKREQEVYKAILRWAGQPLTP
jgi:hypothetical protein